MNKEDILEYQALQIKGADKIIEQGDDSHSLGNYSKKIKKSFLGGYPIGEKELFVMIHFLWLTSFLILFMFVRILIMLSGV